MVPDLENRVGKRPAIVFAGGGHAHLHSLLRTGELIRGGFPVTLINPSPYLYYSGMATGVISGVYSEEEDRIDVRRLVQRGGGRFVEGRVEEIQARERRFVLEDGRSIPYDAASVAFGSTTPVGGLVADGADVLPAKPVENTAAIRARLLAAKRSNPPFGLLVVGGGAAGCEIAANVLALPDGHLELTLVERGGSLLGGAPKRARRVITAYLRRRGARVLTGCAVASVERGIARAADGRELRFDLAVLAVGVSPPAGLFRRSGLPVGDDGGLWVDRNLRCVADERLFGGGDAVSYRGRGLPKVGVYAVRQGPVLFRNLQAVLQGEPLEEYRPQKRFLYVLNLGDGDGLAVYGPLAWHGPLAWKAKDYVDRKFIREHQVQERVRER